MKKCPHCNEKIDKNSRFCLYCLTPLEGKIKITAKRIVSNKKLLTVAVITFLSSILAILPFLGLLNKKAQDNGIEYIYSYESTVSTVVVTNNGTKSSTDLTTVSSDGTAFEVSSNSESADTPSNITSTDVTKYDTVSSNNSTSTDVVSYDNIEITEETINENYSYVRLSEYPYSTELFETYGYSTAFLSDKIAIVSMQGSDDGVYNIPEKIDGYTVFAILKSHSTDDTKPVKCIIIPKTVSLLSDNIFRGIYYPNLTDVYYCGTAINMLSGTFCAPIESQPRENPVNLHCLPNCINTATNELFSLETPRGSVYVEWNGILPN